VGSLKSGEDWFCFVEQPLSKYTSISVEVLILRCCKNRFFQNTSVFSKNCVFLFLFEVKLHESDG